MRRSSLAILAVLVIGVVIAAAFLLMSGNEDPSDEGTPPEGEITLALDETKIFTIQGEEVAFTYEGTEGLNIAIMQNGNPTNSITFPKYVDANWSTYQGFDSYYDYSITFEYRVLEMSADSITFEIKDL